MTQNKAQKIAIRRRMAETGESYVVARRAVLGDGATPEAPGTREGLAPQDQLTPEEQYALEAAAEGASTDEIDAQTLVYRLQAAAERAQEASERARERADLAADAADEAANGEFPDQPDDDPAWAWAEATSGRGRPISPRPPVPPRPPAPPW